jgi:zinc protease
MRRAFVPIRGKTQADIWMGNPGPRRSDPTFMDAAVCNTVLGVFGMMGRLGDTVRNEQGLAYYAYSRVRGGIGPGPWSVVAGVDPANVDQAVDSIRAEIQRMRQEPVPPEELADSQAFLIGSLPLRLETNEGVARAIRDIERYDLGLDYIQQYAGMIQAATPGTIQAAAQQWLDPDAFNLAIAGPPEE